MAHQNAVPAFGKPLKTPEYYATCDGIINTLRPYSTLRTVASHMNSLGLRTPGDLEWHRLHVSNYIRQRGLNTNTNTK